MYGCPNQHVYCCWARLSFTIGPYAVLSVILISDGSCVDDDIPSTWSLSKAFTICLFLRQKHPQKIPTMKSIHPKVIIERTTAINVFWLMHVDGGIVVTPSPVESVSSERERALSGAAKIICNVVLSYLLHTHTHKLSLSLMYTHTHVVSRTHTCIQNKCIHVHTLAHTRAKL